MAIAANTAMNVNRQNPARKSEPRNSMLSMKYHMTISLKRPTVCVTGAGAGVDSAWEQKKLEARKMLENPARPSGSPQRPAVRPTHEV